MDNHEHTDLNNNDLSLVELTADIVSAYVGNNSVVAGDLPDLIRDVHSALGETTAAADAKEVNPRPEPAVNPKRSVTRDYIICLENGKKFKSLKRHLASHHGMTPDEYRERWDLPSDYPMVAPAYAERRSALAKEIGLGRKAKGRKKK